jgi:two-component system LytT family sensor kinase
VRRSKVRSFLLILSVWTGFAVFSAAEGRLESLFSKDWMSWGSLFVSQLEFCTVWAVLTPLVVLVARRFRLDSRPFWRNGLIHLAAALLFAFTAKAIWITIQGLTADPGVLSAKRFLRNLVYMVDYSVVLYLVVVLCCYGLDYYFRYQRGRVSAAELQTELVRAQLRALKAQLHPHFLFNALHTVSSLIRSDPESAERIVARISDLLRLMLRQGGVQLVPLETELEYLELYLAIEKARFEERLAVRFEIAPETRGALVPSLLLQPLVENAIRHGIGKLAGMGQVTVISSLCERGLELRVRDNGPGLPAKRNAPLATGIGLSSIRGRLEHLYGSAQSLVLRDMAGGGVEAYVAIPFETDRTPQEVIYEAV